MIIYSPAVLWLLWSTTCSVLLPAVDGSDLLKKRDHDSSSIEGAGNDNAENHSSMLGDLSNLLDPPNGPAKDPLEFEEAPNGAVLASSEKEEDTPAAVNPFVSWFLSVIKDSEPTVHEDNLLFEDETMFPASEDPKKKNDPKDPAAAVPAETQVHRQLQRRKTIKPTRAPQPGDGDGDGGVGDGDSDDGPPDNGQKLKEKLDKLKGAAERLEKELDETTDPQAKAELEDKIHKVNVRRINLGISDIDNQINTATNARKIALLRKKKKRYEDALEEMEKDKADSDRLRNPKDTGDSNTLQQRFKKVKQEKEEEKAAHEEDNALFTQKIEKQKQRKAKIDVLFEEEEADIERDLKGAVAAIEKMNLPINQVLQQLKETVSKTEERNSQAQRLKKQSTKNLKADIAMTEATTQAIQNKEKEVDQEIEQAELIGNLGEAKSRIQKKEKQVEEAAGRNGIDPKLKQQLEEKRQELKKTGKRLGSRLDDELEKAEEKKKGASFRVVVLQAQLNALENEEKELVASGEAITQSQKDKLSDLRRSIEALRKNKEKLDKKEGELEDAMEGGGLPPKVQKKVLAKLKEVRENKNLHGALRCGGGKKKRNGRHLSLAKSAWIAAKGCFGFGEDYEEEYPGPRERTEFPAEDPIAELGVLKDSKTRMTTEFKKVWGNNGRDRQRYKILHDRMKSSMERSGKGLIEQFKRLNKAAIENMDSATINENIQNILAVFDAGNFLSNDSLRITRYLNDDGEYKRMKVQLTPPVGEYGAHVVFNALRRNDMAQESDARVIEMYSQLKPTLNLMLLKRDRFSLDQYCRLPGRAAQCGGGQELGNIGAQIDERLRATSWPPTTAEMDTYKQEQWDKRNDESLQMGSGKPDFKQDVVGDLIEERGKNYRTTLYRLVES